MLSSILYMTHKRPNILSGFFFEKEIILSTQQCNFTNAVKCGISISIMSRSFVQQNPSNIHNCFNKFLWWEFHFSVLFFRHIKKKMQNNIIWKFVYSNSRNIRFYIIFFWVHICCICLISAPILVAVTCKASFRQYLLKNFGRFTNYVTLNCVKGFTLASTVCTFESMK